MKLILAILLLHFCPEKSAYDLFQETYPPNTVIIKSPEAADPAKYFSAFTSYSFEIYKPADLGRILTAFRASDKVASCHEGRRTADYHQVYIELKGKTGREWFRQLFRSAGITHGRINQSPLTTVDKL